LRLGRGLAFPLLFLLQLFLFLRVLFLQLLRLRLMLLLDLLLFSRIRLLLGELGVFLLLLLLYFLPILLLVCVKLILLLLVLPVQLRVRRGLHDRPRRSGNLVWMNDWRRGRPIGLWGLRSRVRITRTFRRAIIRRVGGRLSVQCRRLVCIRIGVIRRRGPVGVTVRWRRRVIRCGRAIRLHWFRSGVGVRRTIRWAISWSIAGLHGLRRRCLRRFIRGRRPIGLHWFRSGAGSRRTIRWAVRRRIVGLRGLRRRCLRRRLIRNRRPIGLHWFRSVVRAHRTICWVISRRIVGLHSLRWCSLRRLIRSRRPIGLDWFRSFADIRGTFRWSVGGVVGKRYRFVAGIWCYLRGLPGLRLSCLRLGWLVRYGHWAATAFATGAIFTGASRRAAGGSIW
jgi:chorismate-pyruvate lyase